MINIIYGAKGTGKTKEIIGRANNSIEDTKGNIVFLTDKTGYTYQINHSIRLVMMKEYDIKEDNDFVGFLKGLIAGNSDIEHFYIDGIHRICSKDIKDLQEFFNQLDNITDSFCVDFTLAISLPEEEMPEFLDKYYK